MNRALWIALISTIICFQAQAQQMLRISGPNFLCIGECGTYEVDIQSDFENIWILTDPSGQTIAVDSSYAFFYCFDVPGVYVLHVVVDIGPGDPESPIETTLQIFVDYGMAPIITSNAHEFCSTNNGSTNCEQICAGTTVTYTAGTGGVNEYVEWHVIGSSDYEVDPNSYVLTVTWNEAGNGTVIAESYGFEGCIITTSLCVNILENPEAHFETEPMANEGRVELCQNQLLYVTNLTTGAISYDWDFGNGETSAEPSPVISYDQAGTYTLQLIAKNACYCADTTSIQVDVIQAQAPVLDCVSTICEYESGTYTTDADCTIFHWAVSSNGTIVHGGGQADHTITIDWGVGPVGTVTLAVDDCVGDFCIEPATVEVPIISDGALIEGVANVCKEALETYTIQRFGGTYYQWQVTNGKIISGQGSHVISVLWNQPSNLPADASVSVDYENCYLDCSGSDLLQVRIVDEFFVFGPVEACIGSQSEYETQAVHDGSQSVLSDWSLVDADGQVQWTSTMATDRPTVLWPNTPGTYYLLAEPTTADYCNDGFEVEVRLYDKTDEIPTIDGEVNICPGMEYTYTAITPDPSYHVSWTIGDGTDTYQAEGNPILIQWVSNGPYEIRARQTDFSRFPCPSDETSVTLQRADQLELTGMDIVCLEDILSYSASHIDNAVYIWSISPADAGSIIGDPTASTVDILWTETGNAAIKVETCGLQHAISVRVADLPQPIPNHPGVLCAGDTGPVFTTSSYNTYEWRDENGAIVSLLPNPSLLPGSYEVIVTDADGCTGKERFTIDALPRPNIYLSTPDPTKFCSVAGNVQLVALEASPPYTYEWFKDGSSIGMGASTLDVSEFGLYSVRITDSQGCQNSSNSVRIQDICDGGGGGGGCPTPPCPCTTVTGIPDFSFTTTTACNEIDFTNLSTSFEPGSIVWNFDDPRSGVENASDLENPSHKFTNAGYFHVSIYADYPDANDNTVLCSVSKEGIVRIPMAADFNAEVACPGVASRFFDNSTFLPTETITSWSWDFGDPTSGSDNTSTLPDPQHVYSNPGTYTVRLTTSNGVCSSRKVMDVTIREYPDILFDEPPALCELQAVQFTGQSLNQVSFWEWDFGDPASGSANTSRLQVGYHVYDTPGSYTVSLRAENIYGCESLISRTIQIDGNGLAGSIANILPSPICAGQSNELAAPSGGVEWLWSNGEVTEQITVGDADIYSVTITDGEGCTYTPDAFHLDVLPAPITAVRFIERDALGLTTNVIYDSYETCEGGDVILEAIADPGQDYTWSNSMMGPILEFLVERNSDLPAGDYTFSLTIEDVQSGCTNEVGPFQVTVHAKPDPVNIQSNTSGYLCEGEQTVLSVANVASDLTYIWNNGVEGPSLTATVAGEYFVVGINAQGCETESNRIVVNDAPDIGLIPSGCRKHCGPDTLCLPAIPNIASYQWFFNDSPVPAPEGTIPDLIAEQSGTYYVELIDVFGCRVTSDPLFLEIDGAFSITGEVYEDDNLNGVIDASDDLFPDVPLLLIQNGTVIQQSLADQDGYYAWVDLQLGSYAVCIDTAQLAGDYQAYEPCVDIDALTCDDHDSTFVVDFLLYDCLPDTSTTIWTGCAGDILQIGGQPIGRDTVMYVVHVLGARCDSVARHEVTFHQTFAETRSVVVCPGETYIFDGQELSPGEDQLFTYQSGQHCDSTVFVSVFTNGTVNFDWTEEQACVNRADGSFTVHDISGGLAPYAFSTDGQVYQDDPEFTDLSAGTYDLFVRDDSGCVFDAQVTIEAPETMDIDLDAMVLIPCQEDGISVGFDWISGESSVAELHWNTGAQSADIFVSEPGLYTVTLQNECQVVERHVQVAFEDEEAGQFVYIPNAFSPNGDGSNDRFCPYFAQDVTGIVRAFVVMDRWGNTIFRSTPDSYEWDGKVNNDALPPGVYIYMIEAEIQSCHMTHDYHAYGSFTLIR